MPYKCQQKMVSRGFKVVHELSPKLKRGSMEYLWRLFLTTEAVGLYSTRIHVLEAEYFRDPSYWLPKPVTPTLPPPNLTLFPTIKKWLGRASTSKPLLGFFLIRSGSGRVGPGRAQKIPVGSAASQVHSPPRSSSRGVRIRAPFCSPL